MKYTYLNMRTYAMAAVALLMIGCSSDNNIEENNNELQSKEKVTKIVATFEGDMTTDWPEKSSKPHLSKTRTSITYSVAGGVATPLWSVGDKVWVKSNEGTFVQSTAAELFANNSMAKFNLQSGTFSNGCQVNYVGNSSSGSQVTIATVQTQNIVNDFSHAGTSGDCATANATLSGTSYRFKLDHKASYLSFMPRCVNGALGKNIFLTKIKVQADQPIAGTYNFEDGSLVNKTPISGSSNTITLNTNNFPLSNTVSDLTVNGAYMVIAPGTYNLTITYTIKDPATNISGDIVKNLSNISLPEGRITDVTAWIDKDIMNRQGKLYMWDANVGQSYWEGVANYPFVNTASTTNGYPTTSTDARYYNTSTTGITDATRSAASCPNANELVWYVQRGQPYWDADKLWTMDNHLYKAGLWLLKKAYIQGFTADQAPNGTNYRVTNAFNPSVISGSRPGSGTPPNINNYFFLPAEGNTFSGRLYDRGLAVFYWSSTGYQVTGQNNKAARIRAYPSSIDVALYSGRELGCSVDPMQ